MRQFLALLTLLMTCVNPAMAADSPRDSLRKALVRTTDAKEQISINRNLADLTVYTSESCGYLTNVYELAKARCKTRPMMQALSDLAIAYIMLDKLDSVRYFIALAEKASPAAEKERWCCYLRMRLFSVELLETDADKAVEDKIAAFKERKKASESPYKQIEEEFAISMVLYDRDQCEEAEPYLIQAMELAKQLPFRESAPYQLLLLRQMTRIYNKLSHEKAVEAVKNSIALQERYYELYDKVERPYYPIDDFYITQYTEMLINVDILPEKEALYYLNRITELSRHTSDPYQKYNCFLSANNYYTNRKNYRLALSYNDSLIHYARQIAQYNLPGLYNVSSQIHEMLNDPQEALVCLRESHRLQDSISQNNLQDQLNKMRVEYGMNQLNYENSRLEVRSKRILVVSLTIVLSLVMILCIHLYIHLKREQERKKHMQRLKLRAEESEKVKTAFINSICHELRTPLNGIVGYSGLLLDSTIDIEERSIFPDQIRRNTAELVSLVDSMLEVSNLDVSDEKLPCERIDISGLCRTVFDRMALEEGAIKVSSIAELPDDALNICTNERYLSLVVENLLTNAYKFTEQGTVTLRCERQEGEVIISITDTGCGIPAEKRLLVFERFIKLNSYKQGTGLGLYLCKLIVRRLSGRIFIDPSYTAGTRVVVALPVE